MDRMIERVLENMARERMVERGDSVVVAVSGGADSVALLFVLTKAALLYDLRLVVAHLNHGLRGRESDEDELFVRDLACRFRLPFETARLDITRIRRESKGSPEEIAREERYRFLTEVAVTRRAQKIALGHHGRDQAETVLLNFLRGAGTDGLKGMLPVRDGLFIRPLLAVTKEAIEHFLEQERQPYRNDSSNLSEQYLRNRVRLSLLPELKADYNPNMEENLFRLGEIMRQEDDYLREVVRGILGNWNVDPDRADAAVGIGDLLGLHEALQRRVVKTILEGMTPGGKGIGYAHVMAVIDLCRSGRPAGVLHLPGGIRIRRTGGRIDFHPAGRGEAAPAPVMPYAYDLTVPGELTLAETGETVRADFTDKPVDLKDEGGTYLDFDRVMPPLAIRNLRPGDRFRPLGVVGTQKLKKFFIDHKIDPGRRWSMPLVVDQQSVIWIPGLRLDDRVKVTKDTRRFLRIEII